MAGRSDIATDDSYKWQAFTAIAISFFTMVASMSMVFVALSAMATDFGVTLRAATWIVIVEALIISSLLLPFGRLGDMIGRRRLHIGGLTLFMVGAVLVAVAPTFWFLIAARAVMATGNAMSQSVGTAMVVAVFPPQERGTAIGSQTTAVSIGGASGPIIAGLALAVVSWRVLFLLLLIPSIVALVVGLRLLDEERVGRGRAGSDRPLDYRGAMLSAAAVALLVLTFNNPLALPWTSPWILGSVAVAAALFLVFARVELTQRWPMLELRLFNNSTFSKAVATRLIGFMAAANLRLLLPVYLVSLRGVGEGILGVILFLIAVGMGVSAQTAGRLADRFGPRRFTMTGLATLILTSAAFALIPIDIGLLPLAALTLVSGLGQGMWNVANNTTVLGSVSASDLGVVAAFTNLTRNLGNVVGQAIASAVVVGVMVARGFDIPLDEIADSVEAGEAFFAGWRTAFAVVGGLSVIGFVLAATTRPPSPTPTPTTTIS